ncbi:MAG: T9SS type A sorting domain-containing protein [Ignavibacteria bacterium]|nr:T9SS type A sorting domain-containing protein [Ignavibacteria bacterium]
MKKHYSLQFLTAIIILVMFSTNSYSQWTLAGAVTNAGTFPSISVVNQNVVWVAGGPSGTPVVYRTTNGGTNWTAIPTTGVSLELYCIWAVDENTAYVGNGGAAGGLGGNAQFFKTTNAGVSWTQVGATGGSAGFFNGIVFSRSTPNFGVAQSDPPTGSGQAYYISRTTDGGATWTVTNPPGQSGTASAQNSIVVIDNQFYGFGSNTTPPAAILTTDGGTTWNKRNTALIGNFTSGVAFSDNKLTGVVASSTSLPNIARTTDAGVTWTSINTGTGHSGYCGLKWVAGTNTVYLTADQGATGVVKKSTNGGLNWTVMSTSGLTGVTHIDYYRNGATVYGYAATASGAILKVVDNVTSIDPINSILPNEFSLSQNYPNPFNPSTKINFSIPSSSQVSLKVYDAVGKEVADLVNEFATAGNYSVDFSAPSNLTSGVYFYTLSAGEFKATKKLLLVK